MAKNQGVNDFSDEVILRICSFLTRDLLCKGECYKLFPTDAKHWNISTQKEIHIPKIPFECLKFFAHLSRQRRGITLLHATPHTNGNFTFYFDLIHITYSPINNHIGNVIMVGGKLTIVSMNSDLARLRNCYHISRFSRRYSPEREKLDYGVMKLLYEIEFNPNLKKMYKA